MNDDFVKQEINKHGYGFQYAVVSAVKKLFNTGKTKWYPIVNEFPIEIGDTKIDFVLRYSDKPLYIVAECKRVNPALSNWIFLKASASNYYLNRYFFTEALHTTAWNSLVTGVCSQWNSEKIYNIAFEVKENKKGDERGKSRGQIEDAATQVCKGLNGLIRYFRVNQDLHRGCVNIFVPVIFTTANLFTSDVLIENSDLISGEYNKSDLNLSIKEWLHYHYPQTPTIKHGISSFSKHNDLKEIIYCDYIRDIPIVNSNGIENFLCINHWDNINYKTIQMEQQK